MRLRELFEATANEVAIIFGRFNPPHKGHRAAWELASQSSAWFVGTNESTVGPKDPLPYEIKVEAMKAIWPEVEGHIMAETSWLTMASELYKKYPEATLLCLTDEDWVTKTIVQYNGKEGAHGFYNFKDIKQKPTPRLSSATALRDAVTKGDREAFAQAAGVPADTPVAGKPFFDLVAEYLLPYANAPKKVAKKKVAAPTESSDDPWGNQGRFAGDTPVNVGGAIVKKIQVGDIVSYFGSKAKILDLDYTKNYARINTDMKTLNVKLSDLKRIGKGVEEARMSAAVKLQRAWERQQEKSAASRERAKELLNPTKKEEPKKTTEGKGETALEKWRRNSAEREKKHADAEAEIKKLPPEKRSGAAIDRLEKALNKK